MMQTGIGLGGREHAVLGHGAEVPFLDAVDLQRVEACRRLEPTRRTELGQFLTPSPVARLMASMFEGPGAEVRLLDAGAGTGSLTAAFVAEVCLRPTRPRKVSVVAFEVDGDLVRYLRTTLDACANVARAAGVEFQAEVKPTDFLEAGVDSTRGSLFGGGEPRAFTCAILNPPYRKLGAHTDQRRALQGAGVEVSNLYTAFLALSSRMLVPGGELVAITPRSFCNGPYFLEFRRAFLQEMRLRRVHVYESRSRAFSDDEVLQENIILHAQRGGSDTRPVVVSSSEGPEDDALCERAVPYERVVRPQDKHSFIRVIADGLDDIVDARMEGLPRTLADLGLSVSTGPVVDFRVRGHLERQPSDTSAPLVYPCHFRGGGLEWPIVGGRKPNALRMSAETRGLVVPSGVYVLTKRFTSKEERRRVVAVVMEPGAVGNRPVGLENHVNYFHRRGKGLPLDLARGLATFLNSTLIDSYFRLFSGHTQVNASDLRSLRYPSLEQLARLGKRVGAAVSSEALVDETIQSELFGDEGVSEGDPVQGKRKVQQAVDALRALGLPKEQQNDRSGLTLLALLGLKPRSPWSDARAPLRGITEMMKYFERHYGKRYAPNSRETVRRFTVHQFVQAGLVRENPDDPKRPTNSPRAVYQVHDTALALLQKLGTPNWDPALRKYLAAVGTLTGRYARARALIRIPLKLASGASLTLSPGGQNELVHRIVEDFCGFFTPGAVPLYIGDTKRKWAHFDEPALRALGVTLGEHGKMPDVAVLDTRRNWLVLVEAVTSHGPVDSKRREELENLFKGSSAGLVLVTAFLDRRSMVKYLNDIAWETEVWVADAPTHLIHFNGERFLGPHP